MPAYPMSATMGSPAYRPPGTGYPPAQPPYPQPPTSGHPSQPAYPPYPQGFAPYQQPAPVYNQPTGMVRKYYKVEIHGSFCVQ